MEKRSAEDWDGYKLEELARAYMDARKDMWTILGDRIGEKWNIVEAKVGRNRMWFSVHCQADIRARSVSRRVLRT